MDETAKNRDSPINVALGYVVGTTLWVSFFAIMAYGLWLRAWYGYMLAAELAAIIVMVLAFWYREQREFRAEIERIARIGFDESDDPPPFAN
jgi:hypothetical protein